LKEEEAVLGEICENAKKQGFVSDEDQAKLRDFFGERFEKALRLVEEKRVKRYKFEPSGRIVWIAVGREKEYQMLPKAVYCCCDDFYFRVIDGEAGLCYHLIGHRLAEALRQLQDVRDGDEFYEPLMAEWRRQAKESGIARP